MGTRRWETRPTLRELKRVLDSDACDEDTPYLLDEIAREAIATAENLATALEATGVAPKLVEAIGADAKPRT